MYHKKTFYRKPTEDDLSPKAYSLLQKMYEMTIKSGLALREIRLVCKFLRIKVEKLVAECAVGGRED